MVLNVQVSCSQEKSLEQFPQNPVLRHKLKIQEKQKEIQAKPKTKKEIVTKDDEAACDNSQPDQKEDLDEFFYAPSEANIDYSPVAHIFGSTPKKQSCCVHVHSFFPRFYVLLPDFLQFRTKKEQNYASPSQSPNNLLHKKQMLKEFLKLFCDSLERAIVTFQEKRNSKLRPRIDQFCLFFCK